MLKRIVILVTGIFGSVSGIIGIYIKDDGVSLRGMLFLISSLIILELLAIRAAIEDKKEMWDEIW